jgi:transposase
MTVGKWRRRYLASGADGLLDESRPGAPRRISDEDVERVIAATLESKLADATHWSTRSMAREAGGHEDLKTTMRYMHLSPAARESAIRLLDGRPEIAPIFGDIVESGTLEG